MNYDYSLYLVTDRRYKNGRNLEEAVEQAIMGGCSMVQLRENTIPSSEFYYEAKAVKQITDRYHIPLIINNRADIALAVDAAGVHIGQRDIPAAPVRRMIGSDRLLGVSVTSLAEALQARKDGADYLGVGAMLPTKTKEDAKIVPVSELCRIRQGVKIPLVVIGGIRKENAEEFLRLGADGLAVVSAILAQSDVRLAAEELKSICKASIKTDFICDSANFG